MMFDLEGQNYIFYGSLSGVHVEFTPVTNCWQETVMLVSRLEEW